MIIGGGVNPSDGGGQLMSGVYTVGVVGVVLIVVGGSKLMSGGVVVLVDLRDGPDVVGVVSPFNSATTLLVLRRVGSGMLWLFLCQGV